MNRSRCVTRSKGFLFADETESEPPLPGGDTDRPVDSAAIQHENSTTALPAPAEPKVEKKGVELREWLNFEQWSFIASSDNKWSLTNFAEKEALDNRVEF